MNYTIKETNFKSPDTIAQLHKNLGDIYVREIYLPNHPSFPNRIEATTKTVGRFPSLYIGAYEGDAIIGFNAFIAHDLILNGERIIGYQSCWSATSKQHRGKKVFQNMINSAKEILKEKGAAFIFGFPNENSQPIFLKKLGFREITSFKSNIIGLPHVFNFFLNKDSSLEKLNHNSINQNDSQLIKLKKQVYQDDIKIIKYNNSFLWGRNRIKKIFKTEIKYFFLGGISLDSLRDLNPLIHSLIRTEKVKFIQIISTINNQYNSLFKGTEKVHTNHLIIYDLNLQTNNQFNFNFFSGVKDVF